VQHETVPRVVRHESGLLSGSDGIRIRRAPAAGAGEVARAVHLATDVLSVLEGDVSEQVARLPQQHRLQERAQWHQAPDAGDELLAGRRRLRPQQGAEGSPAGVHVQRAAGTALLRAVRRSPFADVRRPVRDLPDSGSVASARQQVPHRAGDQQGRQQPRWSSHGHNTGKCCQTHTGMI